VPDGCLEYFKIEVTDLLGIVAFSASPVDPE